MHFNTAATSFAHSLKIRSCRIVFELVIDLTKGARARNSTDAARARDDIYATQPARSSARAGHVITGRLSNGGALGIRGGNLWPFDAQSIFRPSFGGLEIDGVHTEEYGYRATEQRDELAPFHSINRSARTSNDGGTFRPSAFAVLRLITNSNFVGFSTGKSPGLAPLKILSIKAASRRKMS
jgi:hypothetical protein